MTEQTLSLAGVARLCHVQRPVVSMWRNRPVAGAPFPAPRPSGRFDAGEVLAWLRTTGRGNNPQAHIDIALQTAIPSDATRSELEALSALVAARSAMGRDLAGLDAEQLLDAIEETDPDDEWAWREVNSLDDLESLAARADALVEATWTPTDAHDWLVQRLARQTPVNARLAPDAVELLAAAAGALLGERGEIVDVDGSAVDAVVQLLRNEEMPEPHIVLTGDTPAVRRARQRLAVRGVLPRTPLTEESWELADGSVVLALLPSDPASALDALDALSVELAPGTRAIVLGSAQVLVDELGQLTSRRDAVLRDELLHAVVRLPQGLLADGARGHLGLWLMERGAGTRPRVGDLSGDPLTPARAQQLLDDLVAVGLGDDHRAIELLHPVSLPKMLASSTALTALDTTIPAELPSLAGADAARIQHLLDTLAAPLPNPTAGMSARVAAGTAASLAALGDLARTRRVRVLPGSRIDLAAVPKGSARLWTADSLTTRQPVGVDLFHLTRRTPNAAVTSPDDVVFCSHGKPAACVDNVGGAIVAYPARIIRVATTAPFSPRAVAATINALPAGSAAWRTWQVPVAHHRSTTDDNLAMLEQVEQQLRERQLLVDELRRVVLRTVPCGAVMITRTDPQNDSQSDDGMTRQKEAQ